MQVPANNATEHRQTAGLWIRPLKRGGLALFAAAVLTVPLFGQAGAGKGRLTGTVVDEEGRPVEAARIVLKFIKSQIARSWTPAWREESAVFETETGEQGKWTYQGLAGGIWEIQASKDGYHPSSRQVLIRQLSANPHVTLSLEKLRGGVYSIAAGLLEKANELYALGKYDEAVTAYRSYLEQDPGTVMVMLSLGQCLEESGKPDEAFAVFQSVVDLTSADPLDREVAALALAGLGDCEFKKGHREAAVEHWKKAIETSPSNESAAANLGEVLFSLGRDDEAVSYFRKAIEIAPTRQDIRFGLVNVYLHQGKFDQARTELNRIIKLDPLSPSATRAREILGDLLTRRSPATRAPRPRS